MGVVILRRVNKGCHDDQIDNSMKGGSDEEKGIFLTHPYRGNGQCIYINNLHLSPTSSSN